MSEIRQEKSGFAAWTDRHAELWKFMKFLLAGGGSNVVELAVHMLLLNTVFAALTAEPVTAYFLNLIGITSKGYLYTYMVSTTVGYTIAFILNRKITFKADANPAVSMALYAVMVLFTIFANGWIGSAMTTWARENGWTGNLCDMAIKVIGMLIPMLWTYPCNRFLIHRKRKDCELFHKKYNKRS